MNLVGIDISIDSTGVSLIKQDNDLILFNFTTQKKSTGWIKKTMEYIDYEFINYTYKDMENYTESEIMKLREYDYVTDLIFDKIIKNIDKKDKTLISIENYNYGLKNTNIIVDIVCFSTLLRIKLLNIPGLEKIILISPKSLKNFICEIVYGFTLTRSGKKIVNKNPKGVAGGSFDKKDILIAFYDMNENNKLIDMLNKYKEDLLKLKNVVKPIDDILDGFFLMKTLVIN